MKRRRGHKAGRIRWWVEKQTLDNNYFGEVLFTGKHAQLVVMCLKPGEEIANTGPCIGRDVRLTRPKPKSTAGQEQA